MYIYTNGAFGADVPEKERNMKTSLIAFILCITSSVCSAIEIKETCLTFPEYQGVVTTNLPAQDLFLKAKLWIAENFNSAQDVIQLDSPETNTIVCKGIYLYDQGKLSEMRVHLTLKIEAKENRFRYTITIDDVRAGTKDVSGYSMYIKNPTGKYVTKFSTKFREQIKFWMLGLLNTNINSSSDEDW